MREREWILLNPGPANTSRSVREALVMPDLCHREPEFFEMMRECRARLVRLAGCDDASPRCCSAGRGRPPWRPPSAPWCRGTGGPDREQRRLRGPPGPDRAGPRDLRRGARVRLTTPVSPATSRPRSGHPELSHVALAHHETTTGLLNPVMDVARVAARAGRRVRSTP